jgi:hypothetical protein
MSAIQGRLVDRMTRSMRDKNSDVATRHGKLTFATASSTARLAHLPEGMFRRSGMGVSHWTISPARSRIRSARLLHVQRPSGRYHRQPAGRGGGTTPRSGPATIPGTSPDTRRGLPPLAVTRKPWRLRIGCDASPVVPTQRARARITQPHQLAQNCTDNLLRIHPGLPVGHRLVVPRAPVLGFTPPNGLFAPPPTLFGGGGWLRLRGRSDVEGGAGPGRAGGEAPRWAEGKGSNAAREVGTGDIFCCSGFRRAHGVPRIRCGVPGNEREQQLYCEAIDPLHGFR